MELLVNQTQAPCACVPGTLPTDLSPWSLILFNVNESKLLKLMASEASEPQNRNGKPKDFCKVV